jgi:hypothetical protein
MDVISSSPSSVASVLWQPQPEAWALTVVFKATFQLRPGEALLAPEQEAPREDDRHWSDDRARSLYAASDLAPMKARADVLLVGQAAAPGRRAARSLVPRLVVGEVDKSIEVLCDRTMAWDGSVREGSPFVTMPLVYERAAGGAETWNPVGVRIDVRDAYGSVTLPNLQPPGTKITLPLGRIEPTGFGPIAPSWPSRREKLGRHAATWSPRDWHKRPLPKDFDPGYFNVAPPDQQVQSLRDDAQIVLDNLHPDHPRFVSTLPGVHPRAYLEGRGAQVPMRCDTLWIDVERWLCTLTWRGRVPLEHPQEQGAVLIALEQPGRELAAADVARMLGRRPPPASSALPGQAGAAPVAQPNVAQKGGTRDLSDDPTVARLAAELPFAQAAPRPAAVSPALPAAPVAPGPVTMGPQAAPNPGLLRSPAEGSPWAGAPRPPEPPPAPVRAAAAAEPGRAPWAAARPPAASRPEVADTRILVWFDPESVPRIRRRPPWRQILDELSEGAPDAELDDAALAAEPEAVEDRREVFEILARGEPLEAQAMNEALSEAVRADGKFVAPLVLLEGELVFAFDELSALKATVATVTPLSAGDENLKSALAAAGELLRIPDPIAAPAVPEGLVTRIKDAFAQAKRVVPAGYVEAQTDRALLEKRAYQRRSVFGASHLRALLQLTGGAPPVPSYLPGGVAEQLPMFQRFRARLIAELHLPVDQNEAHPAALKVLALARVAARR